MALSCPFKTKLPGSLGQWDLWCSFSLVLQLEGDVQALVRRFYALQSERVEAYHLLEE